MSAICIAGPASPFVALMSLPCFRGVRAVQSLVFCVVFCLQFFIRFSFFAMALSICFPFMYLNFT